MNRYEAKIRVHINTPNPHITYMIIDGDSTEDVRLFLENNYINRGLTFKIVSIKNIGKLQDEHNRWN